MSLQRRVLLIIVSGIVCVIIATAVLFYCQWRDTDVLMQYAESVFAGDVPAEDTENNALRRYNWRGYWENYDWVESDEGAYAEFELKRTFVLHNFTDGHIWVTYISRVYDKHGTMLCLDGSQQDPVDSHWIIHKTENGWEVVKIIEGP